MSKETLKLALEALQTLHDENMDYLTRNKLGGENNQCMVFAREAITALREALAKPDFWEGYVPEPDKRQQALDKKAENARELGLDYEPARDSGIVTAGGADPRTQRTWVGLSDLNIDELENNYMKSAQTAHEFLRAIEAKLKEKNT